MSEKETVTTEQVVVRRSPKFLTFMVVGIIFGIIAALILGQYYLLLKMRPQAKKRRTPRKNSEPAVHKEPPVKRFRAQSYEQRPLR